MVSDPGRGPAQGRSRLRQATYTGRSEPSGSAITADPRGVPPDGHLSRRAATPVRTSVTLGLSAIALRPPGRRLPPGAAAWAMLCREARPAGRWAVPEGARQGRTPPIGVS